MPTNLVMPSSLIFLKLLVRIMTYRLLEVRSLYAIFIDFYSAASCLWSMKSDISPSISYLQYLNYLDLSFNDFTGEAILSFIGALGNFRVLNLSWTNMSGDVPHQLRNLYRLQSLDLSENYPMKIKSLEWISLLSSLTELVLCTAVNWLSSSGYQLLISFPY